MLGKSLTFLTHIGRVTPIICGMKLDIHELNTQRLDWDDKLLKYIRQNWVNNFGMIQEISGIRFHRAIVPNGVINLDIETIETADASPCNVLQSMRDLREKAAVSLASRSLRGPKLYPKICLYAELLAASLNAVSSHVVKLSFGDMYKKCWKLN